MHTAPPLLAQGEAGAVGTPTAGKAGPESRVQTKLFEVLLSDHLKEKLPCTFLKSCKDLL